MNEQQIALEHAMILFEQGYRLQRNGELGDAIRLYQRSIKIFPTAEAYTFLGWAYSMLNRYEEAIELCEKAIEVDPDYGNPYNDIGSYLIEQQRFEEAIPWLEKAADAPRYEARHFPYINLGRAYEGLYDYMAAL